MKCTLNCGDVIELLPNGTLTRTNTTGTVTTIEQSDPNYAASLRAAKTGTKL